MKRTFSLIGFALLLIVLSGCGSNLTGFNEPSVSVKDIPQEPSQAELISQIESADSGNIESIIANNFYLLDTVTGEDNNTANVYATRQFKLQELVSAITNSSQPEEKSEIKDNQQILVYPNHFVTFKYSEEDQDVLLIEVASDTFVRNNYSPSYLNGFFTYMLLNRMLSTDNWAETRRQNCLSNDCYGGYSTSKRYNSGGGTKNRGMSLFRGGGPGAGK